MHEQSNKTWRLISDFELLWHCWGDEYVVYHSGTGDTHLLNRLAAAVLENLKQTPANVSTLTEHIAVNFDIPPDSEFTSAMQQLMLDLNKFGLIEQVDQ